VNSAFIKYVGPPDLHDASIVAIEQHLDVVVISVRGASGRHFDIVFSGVTVLNSFEPEGMLLYALAELTHDGPGRRFEFVNWDEDAKASLEIEAEDFKVLKLD
jgi:hypothetical protein